MKKLLFFVLLISFSLEEGIFKKSERSKHGEDCVSDSACEEGLFCRLNRCMTNYESKNMKTLGLQDKNLCDLVKLCPANKKCVKHRCEDITLAIETPKNNTENETDVNLLFAGTVLLGQKAYKSGVRLNDTFNYDHLFLNISKDIKSADLSIIAQETVFHINPEETKFPKKLTNTPKELGDSIANAGFQVVLHGSMYSYGQKEKGINNTINFWKTKYPNITVLGISNTLEESQKDYYIYVHNNLKIGIINFSGFSSSSIPKKNAFMVNTINKKKLEDCVSKLKQETDFIIVCVSWGEKGGQFPNKKQIGLAKLIASYGVDLIVGNHPIMVQPVSYIKSDNGNKTLVFWSLGLFVGDDKKANSNIGALANVIISKGSGKAYLSSYNLIPIINHKIDNRNYTVYKLSDYTEELGLQADKKFTLKKAKETCTKLMGSFAHCD